MKLWKEIIEEKSYGKRSHKVYSILRFASTKSKLDFHEINAFSYNYTRRCKKNPLFTGLKYDRVRDRGYMGSNFYAGGYLSRYFNRLVMPNGKVFYMLNDEGHYKIFELSKKFSN